MMIKMYNLIGETKKYLFTLLFILLACPVFGQVDNEVRDDDDSDEPDSAMVDSLLNDSVARPWPQGVQHRLAQLDRKSTRLNSSHANISYAVFCLKKKKYS